MNVRLKRAKELAGYAVQLTKEEGLPTMVRRGAGFVKRRCFGKRARYLPVKKVLEAQRAEMAGKTAADCGLPTISVLTPLYNTPEKYLREFLDSFVGQTAPNGQLCLADASDAAHGDVERIVKEYQQKNQQIVYKKIENKGIAANTNAAAQLATGEYLALADHDDILAPHALYTMGKAILQLRQRGEPDGFLYSDEALFTKSIRRPMVAHFKPDYAPDYLLCCNYICHLAVFQKALWEPAPIHGQLIQIVILFPIRHIHAFFNLSVQYLPCLYIYPVIIRIHIIRELGFSPVNVQEGKGIPLHCLTCFLPVIYVIGKRSHLIRLPGIRPDTHKRSYNRHILSPLPLRPPQQVSQP